MKLGFITCADLSRFFPSKKHPQLTHDDAAAADHLVHQGHHVEAVTWGTPVATIKAQNFDLLIVRSPWDYSDSSQNAAHFFSWLKELHLEGVPLQNPFPLLQWNYNKTYLADLEKWGTPIIPTSYVHPEDDLSRETLHHRLKEGPFVLKPSISAGGRDTFLLETEQDIHDMKSLNGEVTGDFQSWRSGRTFMIQPFAKSVKTSGEWSLIYFSGVYSHAVIKKPKAGEFLVQDELGGSVASETPPTHYVSLGKDAVTSLAQHRNNNQLPLYARVDIMTYEDQPVIGEIELIEPELFFVKRLATTEPDIQALEIFSEQLPRYVK